MTAGRTLRAALVAAAVALAAPTLAACGGDDSTVSGAPSSETLAPPPGGARQTNETRTPASTDGGDYTEKPEAVSPDDAPGYSSPAVGARERGYLSALEDKGVKTGQMSDALVAAGNTICRIRTTGGAAGETTTIADAVAGQLTTMGYSDKKVEDLSRSVVDSASEKLCP